MRRHFALSFLALAPLASAQQTVPDLELRANRALGLAASNIVSLSVQGGLLDDVNVALDIAGMPALMQLQRHSVRSAGFEVREQLDDGSWRTVDPGPVRTLRGTMHGLPGAIVAASWEDEGLFARVRTADGEDYWIEPLASLLPDAGAAQHVLYRNQDILDPQRTCASGLLPDMDPVSAPGGQTNFGGGLSTAEVACDADYEYFLDYGSTGATQNRIESVINTLNLQYESEVSITHALTTVLVRTSSNDPYSSSDASTLLNQFRNEWNANQGSIQRDIAHLFTGKSINGGTIGVAWVGVICHGSYGYGLVESDFNNNFGCATDLSAHELGHNWSAGHCSCTSNTMNPYITCANTFHANFTIPDIVAHRDSRTCLSDGGGGGGGGGTATDVHVSAIAVSKVSAGQGKKHGRATVTVLDDLGAAAAGYSVTVNFSGDLNENVSGVTNSSGVVVLTTIGTKKGKLHFDACVTNVSGGALPYDSGDNVLSCNQL